MYVQDVVGLLMIHVQIDFVMNPKYVRLVHKQIKIVQQDVIVARKEQLLLILVEKWNVKIVVQDLSNLKNVKHLVIHANLDEQIQKQDLNLKSAHVVYQEIMQLEKVRHNVMNVPQENTQMDTVVKLVVVVHQEEQMILKDNHHVLVVERDQYNLMDAQKHAIYVN